MITIKTDKPNKIYRGVLLKKENIIEKPSEFFKKIIDKLGWTVSEILVDLQNREDLEVIEVNKKAPVTAKKAPTSNATVKKVTKPKQVKKEAK